MIKKNQTSQFMKLICWLTFSLSRSCQTFESCGTVIFFFYFTYFYTTYITHVNNKYTVIYLQICVEWTLAIATVHQKEHTMYRYYYISSLAKGFLSAPLLNNDPTRANQKPLPSEDCTGTSSYKYHVISCTHTQVTDDFSCPNH